ncbi:hypothetical protein Pelo_9366 [Pelomyxa schiedti]|nr:hypothetical protein Pelo_9366 [Pelomyxa schiedti]
MLNPGSTPPPKEEYSYHPEEPDSDKSCCTIWQQLYNESTQALFDNQIVPFLSGQGDSFTGGLECLKKAPGVCADDFVMTGNMDEIGLKGGCIIVESTDWEEPLKNGEMKEVLGKLQKPTREWALGLIFCQKTQDSYPSLPTEDYSNEHISISLIQSELGKPIVTQLCSPKVCSKVVLILQVGQIRPQVVSKKHEKPEPPKRKKPRTNTPSRSPKVESEANEEQSITTDCEEEEPDENDSAEEDATHRSATTEYDEDDEEDNNESEE